MFRFNIVKNITEYNFIHLDSCDSNWLKLIYSLENFDINIINKHNIIDYN